MEQMPLISVIIPVYNVEQYLPRCLDSVLCQTYQNLEIILVDDGTKDSSGEICDAYALRDPRIRVIHKENGGLSSARNAGIDIAGGEYLAFLDSDDKIEPNAYESLLSLAMKYDVELVCGGRFDVDSETGAQSIGLCPQREEVISGEELVRRIFLWENIDSAAWDKLYHKRLFRQIRYPVGMVTEDVPTTFHIALDAGRAAMLPLPIYHYYHRPGSITTSAVSDKTFHFSRHTATILPWIRENVPSLEAPARYLRVRSLVHNLLMLELAQPQVREKYRDIYQDSRRQLLSHLGFVLKAPWFGKQERLTDILLCFGLYRPLRSFYHRFK